MSNQKITLVRLNGDACPVEIEYQTRGRVSENDILALMNGALTTESRQQNPFVQIRHHSRRFSVGHQKENLATTETNDL